MTDTLQTEVHPPEPSSPPTSGPNPGLIVAAVTAIVALVALLVVGAVVATRDDDVGMMGNGQMMGGQMMGGQMMGQTASSPTIPGAREVAVTAGSFSFQPAEIHVRAGEDLTIALTATDLVHDFTIDELRFHVAAAPGQTARGSFHAPSTAARYTAYCSVAGHRLAGMTATVVVDPA